MTRRVDAPLVPPTVGDPATAIGARIVAARRRDRIRYRRRLWVYRVLLLVGFLALWEAVSGALIDPFWFSQPSAVLERLVSWVADGSILLHARVTIIATLLGFVLGAGAGLVVGFVLGVSRLLGDVIRPFLTALYSVPRIALAPLFILWFGIGITSKIMFASVIVFFLVFFSSFDAVQGVNRDLLSVVRVMGARRWHVMLKVLVPASLTTVFLGLRVSVPYALVGAVVGEIVASNRGLGYLLTRASNNFDTAGVFAAIFVMMTVAVLLYAAVQAIQRPLLRWQSAGGMAGAAE